MNVRTLSIIFLAVLGMSCERTKQEPPAKPNIILLLTDDQGYGDMACNGNPWIKTPEMDKLHDQSVRLTDFHVGTTCAPTRSGLMTGRNCNEVGVWHTIMGRNFLRQGEVTLAGILKDNGYRTAMFGKWHLGDNYPCRPEDRGFEHALIHGGGGVGQTPDYWNNDYFDDTYFRDGVPEKFTGYCTDIWFDEALKFIEKNKKGPFFCYLATNAPHGPYHVAQKYIDMYSDNDSIPNPNFYGMITNLDENLGKLRIKLREWGIEKNTILILMTDNGTAAGIKLDKHGFPTYVGYNAGMRGKKGSPYEGGHRVPFFIYWPNGQLDTGKDIRHITSYTDVVPTLLDLCDISYQPKLPFEGKSIKPLLKNVQNPWGPRVIITDTQRKEFLHEWKDASIMTDDYRLIKGKELYDIHKDPGQTTDISAEHPTIVDSLRKAYEAWWTRVSQRSDEINPIPVGFDDNEVTLTCHDLHTDGGKSPAWNQTMVRLNKNPNGFWVINVKKKGRYSVALYRYPEEAHAGFNTVVPEGDHIDGDKPYPPGIPVHVVKARLKIGDQMWKKSVAEDALNAVFECDLETGQAELKTWLTDDKNVDVGAYYVYVKKIG